MSKTPPRDQVEFLSPAEFLAAIKLLRNMSEHAAKIEELVRGLGGELRKEAWIELAGRTTQLAIWGDAARLFLKNHNVSDSNTTPAVPR